MQATEANVRCGLVSESWVPGLSHSSATFGVSPAPYLAPAGAALGIGGFVERGRCDSTAAALADGELRLAEAAARSGFMPPPVLRRMSPTAGSRTLETLTGAASWFQRAQVACRAPRFAAATLATSIAGNPENRATIAAEPGCPSAMLVAFSADEDEVVAAAAAANPATPRWRLHQLGRSLPLPGRFERPYLEQTVLAVMLDCLAKCGDCFLGAPVLQLR